MFHLFRKREKQAPQRLSPAAEKLAGSLAARLLGLQQKCADRLDRLINPWPAQRKKFLLVIITFAGAAWCLYLLMTGLTS